MQIKLLTEWKGNDAGTILEIETGVGTRLVNSGMAKIELVPVEVPDLRNPYHQAMEKDLTKPVKDRMVTVNNKKRFDIVHKEVAR
jgi:hypothetical protein